MQNLVTEIKTFCLANYENGYDTIVECYGNTDLIEYIEDHKITCLNDFIKSYAPMISYKNEVRSTAF